MPAESDRRLSPEQERLLDLIGAGLPVAAAARRLRLSARTAERRLAEARRSVGASTNAEALMLSRGRRLVSHDRLTPREEDVLRLVAEGLHDEEIAERLGIARSTVAAVLRSAMATLGVRTRVQAVMKLAEKA